MTGILIDILHKGIHRILPAFGQAVVSITFRVTNDEAAEVISDALAIIARDARRHIHGGISLSRPRFIGRLVEHRLRNIQDQHHVQHRRFRNSRSLQRDLRPADQAQEHGGRTGLCRNANQLALVVFASTQLVKVLFHAHRCRHKGVCHFIINAHGGTHIHQHRFRVHPVKLKELPRRHTDIGKAARESLSIGIFQTGVYRVNRAGCAAGIRQFFLCRHHAPHLPRCRHRSAVYRARQRVEVQEHQRNIGNDADKRQQADKA